jgi:GDP-L-fucose synthase
VPVARALGAGRLFVAGSRTLLGRALLRVAEAGTALEPVAPGAAEPDARDRAGLERLFAETRPDYVIVAGGRSGGIGANRRHPATLMAESLLLAGNVLDLAWRHGVRRLLYVASSCIYPRDARQPLCPDALGGGRLEPTSEAYATARLAGLRLCEACRDEFGAPYLAAVAGDAYGPGDEFDPSDSHVVAGLIRRTHDAMAAGARTLSIWGSGRQQRDFIYVDDLARACLLALARADGATPLNLGTGSGGVAIRDLATTIADVVGFRGELHFDVTRPDGAAIKVLDATPLRRLGFRPEVALRDGLERTYASFRERLATEDGAV